MATRYFTFSDRYVPVRFFEDDTITVTFFIGDEMDKKVTGIPDALKKASGMKAKKKILDDLISAEKADAILARAELADEFAVDQLILYVQRSYAEAKSKNLQASASGKVI